MSLQVLLQAHPRLLTHSSRQDSKSVFRETFPTSQISSATQTLHGQSPLHLLEAKAALHIRLRPHLINAQLQWMPNQYTSQVSRWPFSHWTTQSEHIVRCSPERLSLLKTSP